MINAQDALADNDEPIIKISLSTCLPDEGLRKQYPNMPKDMCACLQVQDDGCGILDEDLKRIFDPFFSRKPLHEGTGLGLSMVSGAIESHHGCIAVDSKQGEGATFTVYLPLQDVLEDTLENAQGKESSEHQGKPYVLFADDDLDVCEVGAELIALLGFEVVVANNGRQALDIFREDASRYVIVILDMMMPQMSGSAAAEAMQDIRPELPILFLTGFDTHDVVRDVLALPNTAMLKKPWDIEVLQSAMQDLLPTMSIELS